MFSQFKHSFKFENKFLSLFHSFNPNDFFYFSGFHYRVLANELSAICQVYLASDDILFYLESSSVCFPPFKLDLAIVECQEIIYKINLHANINI